MKLPILVPDETGADGYATFFPVGSSTYWPKPIRVVTRELVRKNLKKIIKQSEIALFLGIIRLRDAYDAKDEIQLQAAHEQVWPWLESVSHGSVPGWTEDEAKKAYSEQIVKEWDQIRFNYSQLVTKVFRDARLVLWYSEKSENFTPAVFCPDWKTSAFVSAFLGKILVCPNCGNPFLPKSKEIYCTTKCQNTYRQRRFRLRAKARKRRKR
jgi:hypothetical protein